MTVVLSASELLARLGGAAVVERPMPSPRVNGAGPEQQSVITEAGQLDAVLPALLAAPVVGLDCETTGLDPLTSRLRLVQLAIPGRVVLVDCFRLDVAGLTPLLDGRRRLVGHSLTFDLGFLAAAGLPVTNGEALFDTMLAAQLLGAGTPDGYLNRCSLADVADRFLGLKLDKTHQRADWSGPLSSEMLAYAAKDAAILLPLHETLTAALTEAKLDRVARLEMRALPAVAWLERTGAPFDADGWQALSDRAVAEQIRLEGELTTLAGTGDMLGRSTINWASPAQVAQLLRDRGHGVERADEATLKRLADLELLSKYVLEHRETSKRASVYGIEFLRNVHPATGRIHADYHQIGAATGRMSCSDPNLQQVPRDPAYRACFRPAPGRVLVKADYSQIELRIAAQIAQDPTMIEAYQRGADLHTVTAATVLGRPGDVLPEDRQKAKAINFGLLYGMGAEGLVDYAAGSYGVKLTVEEATSVRDRFFATYRGLRAWHRSQPKLALDTRTIAGRRRLAVEKFTEKLNSPVQGTGADGLKAALALLWERRDQCPSAAPVLCVHDEIVIECDADQAEAARDWLVKAMTDGMSAFLNRVPVEVEAKIVVDWSSKA